MENTAINEFYSEDRKYSSASTSAAASPSASTSSFSQNQGDYKELFHEEVGKTHKPWWAKPQFFVVEPVLFGTWDGVFTSCLINIFGVVLFLRTGWMVGNVGIGLAILIVCITVSVALLAALAAIGICERLRDVQTGGVYYLVSNVLGGKIGGTLGVMYAFGLSVVAALYCTGFAESVAQTIGWESTWAVRGIAIVTLLLLLGINLAGVKWVIRMQLLLLMVLIISTTDFIVGTLVHTDADAGFVGYSKEVLQNNTGPSYQQYENFFTVFGVFFPTATGVMAGVNMSGDLKNPARSIPVGTLSAIALTFFLYLVFVMLLGSTCWRWALKTDYMIAEKVSAVGVLWLAGVYMSSTSSCSTGLYGAPRVLQSLANQNAVPAIKFLGKGFGANKTPILAICASGFIALLFILVGQVNAISPIITCNFMLVYAIVDYSYFALAMTYDLRVKNMDRYKEKLKKDTRTTHPKPNNYGGMFDRPTGTMTQFTEDLDKIRSSNPSRRVSSSEAETSSSDVEKKNVPNPVKDKTGREYLQESFLLSDGLKLQSETSEEVTIFENNHFGEIDTPPKNETGQPDVETKVISDNQDSNMHEIILNDVKLQQANGNVNNNNTVVNPGVDGEDAQDVISTTDSSNMTQSSDKSQLINGKKKRKKKKKKEVKQEPQLEVAEEPPASEHDEYIEILRQPNSWYKFMCNRWASLFGVVVTVVVMFLIQWLYALMNILAFSLIYVYISQANPGAHPGVANEFHFFEWVKQSFVNCCRSTPPAPEQIVVASCSPQSYSVIQEQLNSDNEDFADRGRFHQATTGNYDFSSSQSTLLK